MQEKKLFLREAEPSDLDLLFEWANNEFVRQNAFHTKPITYEEHKKWFEKLLNDREQIQFIMYLGDEPVGQARLTVNMEEAEIDYSIAAEKRGMGYGKELIRLVQDIVYNEYASIKKLTAKVKASNAASIYCFRKNGFSEVYHQYEYEMAEHRPEKNIEPEISGGGGQETFLYLTNNKNTLDLFEWISKRCSAVILSDRLDIDVLKRLRPKLVISYNYIYMISKECIEYMDGNMINMHISYLPWNRGFSPNIWSFIDNTPKGATIHQVALGLDEGDILFQSRVDFDPDEETFETTYKKLNDTMEVLFQEHWEELYSGTWKACTEKQNGKGTYHTAADLRELRRQTDFKWSENIADFLKRYHEMQEKRLSMDMEKNRWQIM